MGICNTNMKHESVVIFVDDVFDFLTANPTNFLTLSPGTHNEITSMWITTLYFGLIVDVDTTSKN